MCNVMFPLEKTKSTTNSIFHFQIMWFFSMNVNTIAKKIRLKMFAFPVYSQHEMKQKNYKPETNV